VHPHREEAALRVQRQLGVRHVIAAVCVGDERLAALRCPADGPADAPARPHHRRFLGIQVDLGTEAAADVGRDHAHLVLGEPQHERGHQQALDVRILACHVQRVRIVGAAVRSERGTRLDRIGHETIVDEFDLRDVGGAGERCIDRRLVADRPRVAAVARCLVVDPGRTALQRFDGAGNRRQHLVVDRDGFGGVLCLVARMRDHHRHGITHVAHLSLRQHRMRRLVHRLAVGAGDEPAARQPVHPREILAGVDRDDPRHRLRLGRVDGRDARVRVRRAQEEGVRRIVRVHVVGELPGAGEEADVLLAKDRLADRIQVVRAHAGSYFIAAAPCSTALTMFW